MKKILITGANGMLATDFKKYCKDFFEIIGFDKLELDITNLENIKKNILEIKPDIILNCAAYTAVDNAQDIGKIQNFEINTIGTYNLAKVSNELNIDFITISTDYVFEGKKETGYDESDVCNPINEYGTSKYLGEKLALSESKNSIIIRTSWLYGGGIEFKSFVNTMLNLSKIKKELKIVNDQFGIPTNTKDLSLAIKEVVENIEKFRGNILHFSNSGEKAITWFEFANEIFNIKNIKINLIPCSSDEFITKAKRPKFSLLKNNSNIKLQNWKKSLQEYLNIL